MSFFKIGSCSWNYESWQGLVYSRKFKTSAEYLKEYAQKYKTVEIDSWFYKMPDEKEVDRYKKAVSSEFSFTCKVPQALTLTHDRATKEANKSFLSVDLFKEFLRRINGLNNQLDLIMFEFEYMNKSKMKDQKTFLANLENFIKNAPREIPIGIESRNGNYLNKNYFAFLKDYNLTHVLSEKLYMPPIINIIDQFTDYFNDLVLMRLLGGDRKLIEVQTKEKWNKIVDRKDKSGIILRIHDFLNMGKSVIVNANNHFEGSSPITIMEIEEELNLSRA